MTGHASFTRAKRRCSSDVWSCEISIPNIGDLFDAWTDVNSIPMENGGNLVSVISRADWPEITVYMVCKISEEVTA